MKLDPDVHHIAKHYLIGLSFGLWPLFAANVLRYFFDAQGFTRITMVITVLAVPANFVLNYSFIFGNFGMPALGGIGAGYATALTYWLIFLVSLIVTFKVKVLREYRLFLTWFRPSITAWRDQLKLGVPIGLSTFF